jgi:hypothetical protein
VHAQTLALDVTLVPGGVPAERSVASIPALWTAAGAPLPPGALQVAVSSQERLTVFSAVEGRVQLDVGGADRGEPRDMWQCTYEARVTLLDHNAVLPALWDLQVAAHDGRPERWLALFTPATGPFRALFPDPEAAQAFAAWLRATAMPQAGRYQLGLFEADRGTDDSTIPPDPGHRPDLQDGLERGPDAADGAQAGRGLTAAGA